MEEHKRKKISYSSSFVAGLDPTGSKTFDIAQKSQRHKGHLVSGAIGGAIGGFTIIPSAVGAAVGAVKGLKKGKGLSKIKELVKGFGSGSVRPYKQLYYASKAHKGLKGVSSVSKIDDDTLRAVAKLDQGSIIKDKRRAEYNARGIRDIIKSYGMRTRKAQKRGIETIRESIGSKKSDAAAGLAFSSGLGTLSSIVQYKKGKETGDKLTEFSKKASFNDNILKSIYRDSFAEEINDLKKRQN